MSTFCTFLNICSGHEHCFAVKINRLEIAMSWSFTAVTNTTLRCVFVCFLLIPQQSSKKNCVQRLSPLAQSNISGFDVFSAHLSRNSIQHWWYNRILKRVSCFITNGNKGTYRAWGKCGGSSNSGPYGRKDNVAASNCILDDGSCVVH